MSGDSQITILTQLPWMARNHGAQSIAYLRQYRRIVRQLAAPKWLTCARRDCCIERANRAPAFQRTEDN